MGREVRMVPKDWVHPQYSREEVAERGYLHGRFKPLHGGSYAKAATDWDAEFAKWDEGLRKAYSKGDEWVPHGYTDGTPYEEYAGKRPVAEDYMPDWPESERTHFMMYEDTSEGTPISPAFETPEELARWLADNGASSFGSSTATYDQWLYVCRGGWAPSAVVINGEVKSGVEALADSAA